MPYPHRPEPVHLDGVEGLADEPRVLQDPRFLGALHAEFERALGAPEARTTLLRLGFYQGLRDATHLLHQGLLAARPEAGVPAPPQLAMRIATAPRGHGRGYLAVRGRWPERGEAGARVTTLGASRTPACYTSAGYTSGWLSGLFESDLLAVEIRCAACGAESCEFEAREARDWCDARDGHAEALVGKLDFPWFRDAVARELASRRPPPAAESAFDPSAAVVHVWGPVMVVPFAGAEGSIEAIKLVHRDPGAAGVRVIVLDLTGVVLDEGLGALALERVLDAIGSTGAETILAGVSSLSQAAVADLERGPFLREKDLAQAIASAFRIADIRVRRPA